MDTSKLVKQACKLIQGFPELSEKEQTDLVADRKRYLQELDPEADIDCYIDPETGETMYS